MKQTIAEKILSEHSKKRVFAGDVCIADLDLIMAQDGTAPLSIKVFEKMERINVIKISADAGEMGKTAALDVAEKSSEHL